MPSPSTAAIERELENELNAVLAEIAETEAGQITPSIALPARRIHSFQPRRGPLALPPEILRGRPFLHIDYFGFDKSAMNKHQLGLIEKVARYVTARSKTSSPITRIRLVGHTDSRGPASYNAKLGRNRAAAVRDTLLRSMERRTPGISRRVSVVIQSAGATQPLRHRASPAGPGLNRRVTVYLDASRPSGKLPPALFESTGTVATSAPILSPMVSRPCCILAPKIPTSNFVDPANLGTHGDASTEQTGLIYSGKAGFMDLGHIRDMIDVTKFLYDQISAVSGAPTTVKSVHGEAKILSRIPQSMFIPVARRIANDDGFAYEILTYWMSGPGTRNSSFSPEDLCSNNLGTLVAEKAILAGGNFNAAATSKLDDCVKALGGLKPAETLASFNLINNCWVRFLNDDGSGERRLSAAGATSPRDSMEDGTLQRPGHTGFCHRHARGGQRCLQLHAISRPPGRLRIPILPPEVAAIRKDAVAPGNFGPNFDKPTPCP